MCSPTMKAAHAPRPTLHRGHARMLKVAGALRSRGEALKEGTLAAEWESVDAAKAAAERPIRASVQGIWKQQREQVLRRLGKVAGGLGVPAKASPDDELWSGQLLDEARWNEALKRELGEALAGAIQEGFHAGGARVELDRSSGFQSSPRTDAVLKAVLGKSSSINATTRSGVADAIREGLRSGESIDAISRRVAGYFEGMAEWRAQVIAQTSATPTFEVGQQEAFQSAGIDENKWFSQRDGKVRLSHWDADGQVRPIGTAFDVGDAKLQYPGDPQGPAREVIGCRCTLFPVRSRSAGGEEEGKGWRAQRNAEMRAAYPALRDEEGKWGALSQLAGEHGLSASTVEDIVYQKGHYST